MQQRVTAGGHVGFGVVIGARLRERGRRQISSATDARVQIERWCGTRRHESERRDRAQSCCGC